MDFRKLGLKGNTPTKLSGQYFLGICTNTYYVLHTYWVSWNFVTFLCNSLKAVAMTKRYKTDKHIKNILPSTTSSWRFIIKLTINYLFIKSWSETRIIKKHWFYLYNEEIWQGKHTFFFIFSIYCTSQSMNNTSLDLMIHTVTKWRMRWNELKYLTQMNIWIMDQTLKLLIIHCNKAFTRMNLGMHTWGLIWVQISHFRTKMFGNKLSLIKIYF